MDMVRQDGRDGRDGRDKENAVYDRAKVVYM